MSEVVSQSSYVVSADIGLFQVRLKTVVGYDVEDIVQDKAFSQARAVQMLNLGKQIDQGKPVAQRTISSVWLNNTEELGT
jgi:hypothetical protein